MTVCTVPTSAAWHKNDAGEYSYTLSTGKTATGFTVIKQNTYYFDKTGKMLIGKYKISGKTYTFGADGKLTDIDGKAYKFAIDKDFLAGTFGDSLSKLQKKDGGIVRIDGDDELTIATDFDPEYLKLGKAYAISTDAYFLSDDKYFVGSKFYKGKSEEVTDMMSSMALYARERLTKSECRAIYKKELEDFEKKYGAPTEIGEYDKNNNITSIFKFDDVWYFVGIVDGAPYTAAVSGIKDFSKFKITDYIGDLIYFLKL
jgi:hypothetical protein